MSNFRQLGLWLALMLLIVCWQTTLAVGAQGLVGPPVDPRLGTECELGRLALGGYDSGRDIARVVTAISAVLAISFGLYRSKKVSGKQLVKELLLLVLIPSAIYFGGLYVTKEDAPISRCEVASQLRLLIAA